MDLAARGRLYRILRTLRLVALRRYSRERRKLAHTRGEAVPRPETAIRTWVWRCRSIRDFDNGSYRGSVQELADVSHGSHLL